MWPKTHYQYYTNINYKTCADCLAWHGRIAGRPERFPDFADDCERAILAFPWRQRRTYLESRRTMQRLAKAELSRRDLFHRAEAALANDLEEAVSLFARAAAIDVYVPELEQFVERQDERLTDPEIRERLRCLFRKAFSDKFGRRRYERLPELMRIEREKAGMSRIDELFG